MAPSVPENATLEGREQLTISDNRGTPSAPALTIQINGFKRLVDQSLNEFKPTLSIVLCLEY